MGMYDVVEGVEDSCPVCGTAITGGHWKSYSGPCELDYLPFYDLDDFKGSCSKRGCRGWVEYVYRDDMDPEHYLRRALIQIATGQAEDPAEVAAVALGRKRRRLQDYQRIEHTNY